MKKQDVLLTLLEPHTILALATSNIHNKSRDSFESAGKLLLKCQQPQNYMAGDGLVSENQTKH